MTNLLNPLPDASGGEVFDTLLSRPGCRIERIVSRGQVTPPDRPYVQSHDEWVLILAGRAVVEVAGAATDLLPGGHLFIPAGAAHRVTFTDPDAATIWLAVHIGERSGGA